MHACNPAYASVFISSISPSMFAVILKYSTLVIPTEIVLLLPVYQCFPSTDKSPLFLLLGFPQPLSIQADTISISKVTAENDVRRHKRELVAANKSELKFVFFSKRWLFTEHTDEI